MLSSVIVIVIVVDVVVIVIVIVIVIVVRQENRWHDGEGGMGGCPPLDRGSTQQSWLTNILLYKWYCIV